MNGLSELNTFGSQTVTVSDSRKARIVFESENTSKNSEISFGNGVFTFRITKDLYPFVIQEIINYQTCLPKLYITIKPSSVSGTTISQTLVTPVTSSNPTSNLEYVLSGYTNHEDWNNNLEFIWNLPSDIANLKALFLTFNLVWLDEATGLNKQITWDVYDIDYYYMAAFESKFINNVDAIRLVRGSIDLVSKFVTGATQAQAMLTTAMEITCDGSVIKNAQGTFNAYCISDATATSIFGGLVSLSTKVVQYARPKRTPFNCQVRVDFASGLKNINWTVKTNQSFIINYGDGTSQTFTTSSQATVNKTYNASGLYDITISDLNGNAIELSINNNLYSQNSNATAVKLVKVRSWGEPLYTSYNQYDSNITWHDWNDFFIFQDELIDVPEYEPMLWFIDYFLFKCSSLNSSNLQYWFQYNSLENDNNNYGPRLIVDCSSFNQPVNTWNVSKVTDMTNMFGGCSAFNQPVNNWDVSNVTSMGSMFGLTSFNQSINNWNVSNVRNMSGMFADSPFNQSLSNWNTSNVRNMANMFRNASAFNQDISIWNVSNVSDMNTMFKDAIAFNQPLNSWNVSNVSNMSNMFNGATIFDQPLSNWNVSKVTNMYAMFRNVFRFNQSLNNWNVSNVTNMDTMFTNCQYFNQPLNNWNVANVTNMDNMFYFALRFDQNISNWKVTQIPTKPAYFDNGTSANWTTAEKPRWGV